MCKGRGRASRRKTALAEVLRSKSWLPASFRKQNVVYFARAGLSSRHGNGFTRVQQPVRSFDRNYTTGYGARRTGRLSTVLSESAPNLQS